MAVVATFGQCGKRVPPFHTFLDVNPRAWSGGVCARFYVRTHEYVGKGGLHTTPVACIISVQPIALVLTCIHMLLHALYRPAYASDCNSRAGQLAHTH